MKLFKQLCSIAVVFMFLCGIAMATEIVDPDTNPPPGSTDEAPAEPNTDPQPEETPGTLGEPESPTGSNEADDPDEPDDPDEEDEEEDTEDDLDIYSVTLPTKGTMDFFIDPLGLSGLAKGESVSLDELDAGRIYPKSEIPAVVLNESSMPLKLTVTLKAVNNEGNERVRFIKPLSNLESTKSAVFSGDGLNVLLYAVPSRSGVSSVVEGFDPSDLGFVITEEGVELTFLLPAAEYKQTGADSEYTLVRGTGAGTQIRIGGYVNDTSDWSGYTDDYYGQSANSISLKAVFSLTKLYDNEFETSTQPVAGAKYLRAEKGTEVPYGAIILDMESIDTLIPHNQITEVVYATSQLPLHRKREENP